MFTWFEKLIDPFSDKTKTLPPNNFFSFIWFCTFSVRSYIFLITLLGAIIAIFEAFIFKMMGKVIDYLSNIHPATFWYQESRNLIRLALILIISILFVGLQTVIKRQTLFGNFPMMLRWKFHRLMLKKSMSFYQDEFAGRIASQLMQIALAVRDICIIVSDIIVFVIVYFVTTIVIIGNFNPLLLLPFLTWFVFYSILVYYFVPRLSFLAHNQADARSLMTGRIVDAYFNIAIVKLFAHAGIELAYAKTAMQDFLSTVTNQMRAISSFEIINHIFNMMLIISTTGDALWLWSQGNISVGHVSAAIAMALRLNGFSYWIIWETASLFEHVGTVQDAMNTLSYSHNIDDLPDAKPLLVRDGSIYFESVNFSYDVSLKYKKKSVIKDFTLYVSPGEKIGLIGRSGSGKSTIFNLILRLYNIQSGKILIDNQDIEKVTQDSLRSQIGVVTQDTSLLHRSIRDNILYGCQSASDSEMISAARQAGAHDFIVKLVDSNGRTGYSSHVGERGIKLSGGQRQRIAIARVILKNAPILLLDEATSALDSEIEIAIQKNLYTLMKNKTVIAIAHRLSTIAAMDRLLVIEDGKILEQGSHQELLNFNGLYTRLWLHQNTGFIGKD